MNFEQLLREEIHLVLQVLAALLMGWPNLGCLPLRSRFSFLRGGTSPILELLDLGLELKDGLRLLLELGLQLAVGGVGRTELESDLVHVDSGLHVLGLLAE